MNATIAIGNVLVSNGTGAVAVRATVKGSYLDVPTTLVDDEAEPAASSVEDTVDFVFQTARGTNRWAWQQRRPPQPVPFSPRSGTATPSIPSATPHEKRSGERPGTRPWPLVPGRTRRMPWRV
jgi:hypothetical protein